jgi:hypothetical protein
MSDSSILPRSGALLERCWGWANGQFHSQTARCPGAAISLAISAEPTVAALSHPTIEKNTTNKLQAATTRVFALVQQIHSPQKQSINKTQVVLNKLVMLGSLLPVSHGR